jgi:hypothetical protein
MFPAPSTIRFSLWTFMDERRASMTLETSLSWTSALMSRASPGSDWQYWDSYREYFPFVGGYWSNGAAAGLWNVHCYGAASNSGTDIGARWRSE